MLLRLRVVHSTDLLGWPDNSSQLQYHVHHVPRDPGCIDIAYNSLIYVRCPSRINCGSSPVLLHRAGSGQCFPVSREFVFDIDLTDYDDVRTCGSGAHVCNRCWPLMAAAVQVCFLRGPRRKMLFASWLYPGLFMWLLPSLRSLLLSSWHNRQ
jgi:hypothetical protein